MTESAVLWTSTLEAKRIVITQDSNGLSLFSPMHMVEISIADSTTGSVAKFKLSLSDAAAWGRRITEIAEIAEAENVVPLHGTQFYALNGFGAR